MDAPDEPVLRWHEPAPSARRVLLLGSAVAGLLALAVVTLVVDNVDVAVVSGVLGLAAAADLWRDLRPRAFVLAGEDGVVVSDGRRTTVVPWAEVVDVTLRRRALGRDRAQVVRTDGSLVRLPPDAPVEELRRRRPRA